MKRIPCPICGNENVFADDGAHVSVCSCRLLTALDMSPAERKAYDRYQARCKALGDQAAKELAALEGQEGEDAYLSRHLIIARRNVREAIEDWIYETNPGSPTTPEQRADVLWSVALDMITTAFAGMMHRSAHSRGLAFAQGFNRILQSLMRRKLIPQMPFTPVPEVDLKSAFLDQNGKPFKHTRH